ncbi:recombination protein RecR [Candidatus Dependentiae bacterium]|nr:recombination protein RecR [Candidatus Dependentiae bacterium]
MNSSLPSLQKLIRHLQKVPYLASKNVYKVASYFLASEEASIASLCQAILEAKKNIVPCQICFNWTEGSEKCSICSAVGRDQGIVCVVETWHDLMAIERTSGFNGSYHVLGAALNPLEGIGPDQLTLQALLQRLASGTVREVILGTNPTPEGEATASYLASKIHPLEISVSKFASGIPTGASLEFMDKITISKALMGRIPF